MRLLGLDISVARKAVAPTNAVAVGDRGAWWWPVIREPFTGAWQTNQEQRAETILAFSAVYACVSLISQDVGKLRIRLVEQDSNGIWHETTSAAFSPVLAKPNHWQTRIQFYQQWVISKLLHGNTYALKERDNRQIVTAMYILDPTRTKALVTPLGDVYYQITPDTLAGVTEEGLTVPASEVIHDMMPALYHPLCGVSPLTACGMAASHGLSVQRQSRRLFTNNSRPGGLLTAPGAIDEDTGKRLKAAWEENFSGENAGRVAVVGDGLQYTSMVMNAVDAQLIEQLNMDEKQVCTAYHVPGYMVGVGGEPTYGNIEARNQAYYSQCLQTHIESIELCLDEGLGLVNTPGHIYGTEFDLDDLLRMDTQTKVATYGNAVLHALMSPDEARRKFDLSPVPGGAVPYLQQQNFSLEALAKRDAQDDPFTTGGPPASGGFPIKLTLAHEREAEPEREPPQITYDAPPQDEPPHGALLRDALWHLDETKAGGNPFHKPGGPGGGQFTSGSGGGGGVLSTIAGWVAGLFATGEAAAAKVLAEWTAKSPFKTLEAALKAADGNQNTLATVGTTLQKELGGIFVNPGAKTLASAASKLAARKTTADKLTDIVRGGFMVESPAHADRLVDGLKKHLAIVDEGWKITKVGYFDRALKVRFKNGQIGEVQMWQPALFHAKERGGGHALYEKARVLPPGHADLPGLERQMTGLYAKTVSSLPQEWKALAGSLGK